MTKRLILFVLLFASFGLFMHTTPKNTYDFTEIALAASPTPEVKAPEFCQFGRFEPCVCWQVVPETVSYKPAEPACRGNAAVITRGNFLNVFSVVVRDKENRDRWPNPNCETNSCSVFKTQKKFVRTVRGVKEKVWCLGAPGRSSLFKNVVRITIKVSDKINPKTGLKDLRRFCLKSPKAKLN